jgi:hypothetical protein
MGRRQSVCTVLLVLRDAGVEQRVRWGRGRGRGTEGKKERMWMLTGWTWTTREGEHDEQGNSRRERDWDWDGGLNSGTGWDWRRLMMGTRAQAFSSSRWRAARVGAFFSQTASLRRHLRAIAIGV